MNTKINFRNEIFHGFYQVVLTTIIVIFFYVQSNAQTCTPSCGPDIDVYNCTSCTLKIVLRTSCGTDYTNVIDIPPGGVNCQTVPSYTISLCRCINDCCDCVDAFVLYDDPGQTVMVLASGAPVEQDFPNPPTTSGGSNCTPCQGQNNLHVQFSTSGITFSCN